MGEDEVPGHDIELWQLVSVANKSDVIISLKIVAIPTRTHTKRGGEKERDGQTDRQTEKSLQWVKMRFLDMTLTCGSWCL